MKFFNTALSIALLAGTFCFVSCSSEDDEPPVEPTKDYKVQLTLTDNGFDLGSGQSLATPATAGDKAGLFVVDNGTLVASNVELTYDGTVWSAAETVPSTGTHYFVYKPFKTDAASKVTASATDAAGFFKGLVDAYAKPSNNQTNIEANVLPFDMVYASAAVTSSKADITEDLKLTATATHAFAITSWELPGNTTYTTSSGFSYSTPGGAKLTAVKVGSAKITPCNIAGTPAYFYVAGSTDKLTVEYTLNGQATSSDIALDAAAGTRSHKVIGGGNTNGGQRELAIGDLYYCDGSVLPVENLANMTTAPEGVAGVIFCTDPSRFSAEEKALLGEVHALVISAKMADVKGNTYIVWNDGYPKNLGDDGAGRNDETLENDKFPGMVLPVLVDGSKNAAEAFDIDNADISGYKYSNVIRTRRADEIKAGAYPAWAGLTALNEKVAVDPTRTTGWYMPSVGQMLDVMRNLGKAAAVASNVEHYYTGEPCDYDFGTTATPNLRGNLDSFLSKVPTGEKSLYTTSDNNLATSSYSKLNNPYTFTYTSGVRSVCIDQDLLYVFGADVISKYNVRGVLAF